MLTPDELSRLVRVGIVRSAITRGFYLHRRYFLVITNLFIIIYKKYFQIYKQTVMFIIDLGSPPTETEVSSASSSEINGPTILFV